MFIQQQCRCSRRLILQKIFELYKAAILRVSASPAIQNVRLKKEIKSQGVTPVTKRQTYTRNIAMCICSLFRLIQLIYKSILILIYFVGWLILFSFFFF